MGLIRNLTCALALGLGLCNAAAAVAGSGMVCHSIRSIVGTLGPAVKLDTPDVLGT